MMVTVSDRIMLVGLVFGLTAIIQSVEAWGVGQEEGYILGTRGVSGHEDLWMEDFVLGVAEDKEGEKDILGHSLVGQRQAASRQEVVTCPSTDLIRTRARCRKGSYWVDCYRDSCCPQHTLVVGRCIADTEDPCSEKYGLCEQQCSTYFGRVICTCFTGYQFNKTRLSLGILPTCQDKDECQEDNGGCEQQCRNTAGARQCACQDGMELQEDETSCRPVGPEVGGQGMGGLQEAAFRAKPAVRRLQRTVNRLEERFRALNSAIKLYSFAGGAPGPEGPPGPPGPAGPRGFPGPEGGDRLSSDTLLQSTEMDSYVSVAGPPVTPVAGPPVTPVAGPPVTPRTKGKRGPDSGQFCTCTRGPVGPPGASGESGPRGFRGEQGLKGPKGAEGSFDFLMAMMRDVRADIELLKEKVLMRGTSIDPRKFGGQG